MTRQYDPDKTNLVTGPHLVSGYSPETFIQVQQVEAEKWITRVGADGEVGRSRRNDDRATIIVTLQQESPSNDVFSALLLADRNGRGVFPVMLKDLFGTTVASAAEAYFQGPPAEVGFGIELQNRQWTIYVPRLVMHVGGNIQAGDPVLQ